METHDKAMDGPIYKSQSKFILLVAEKLIMGNLNL